MRKLRFCETVECPGYGCLPARFQIQIASAWRTLCYLCCARIDREFPDATHSAPPVGSHGSHRHSVATEKWFHARYPQDQCWEYFEEYYQWRDNRHRITLPPRPLVRKMIPLADLPLHVAITHAHSVLETRKRKARKLRHQKCRSCKIRSQDVIDKECFACFNRRVMEKRKKK